MYKLPCNTKVCTLAVPTGWNRDWLRNLGIGTCAGAVRSKSAGGVRVIDGWQSVYPCGHSTSARPPTATQPLLTGADALQQESPAWMLDSGYVTGKPRRAIE